MRNVKQGDTKYHFLVFGMNRPRIEPQSPGPLAKTLPTKPMSQYIDVNIVNINVYLTYFINTKDKINLDRLICRQSQSFLM